MLKDYMGQLVDELGAAPDAISSAVEGVWTLYLEDASPLFIREDAEGFSIQAEVCPLPQGISKEELYCELLSANLFHRATYGADIGLSEDGNEVVLSQLIRPDLSYIEFRDRIEDFANAVTFWQNRITAK